MALYINPNSPNKDLINNRLEPTSPLKEVANRIPLLLPPEEMAGLGSTHQVIVGTVRLKESFEKAKKDATLDGKYTSCTIEKYGITDQDMLFEIAKISAAQNGWSTSRYIQNYGITDPDRLFEIAKIAAAQNSEGSSGTSAFIKNYGFTDQNMLFAIAKIAAAQNGEGTSLHIKRYGITDQNMLFEIAKIAAAQNSSGTSASIQNYGITDQDMLFEIAKISAAQNSSGTHAFIQKYGITNQNMLFEIAKIAAAQNGLNTSEFIQKYGITDQDMLFEIAKIAAAQDGWATSRHIQNYGITDPDMLFEIAKIAAAQNSSGSSGTSVFIKNYGITDQNRLFAIAKIAAAQDGWATSEHIKRYGITDQNMLFEIAKISAAQDGGETSSLIENYGITDQSRLFEIAKIAAAQDGKGTSIRIRRYGIRHQDMRFEIAKIAACQNGAGTSLDIENYGIWDDDRLQTLYQMCFAQIASLAQTTDDFSDLTIFLKKQKSPPNEKLFDLFAKICALTIPLHFATNEEKEKIEKDLKEAFHHLKTLAVGLGASDEILDSLEHTLFEHTSLQQQKKDILWLGALVIHYVLDPAETALQQSPLYDKEIIPLLNCILKMTHSALRDEATRTLITGYLSPEKINTLKTLLTGIDERLNLVVLFSTVAGFETETTAKLLTELAASKFKDAKLMAPINELLCLLYKSSLLSIEKKQQLLQLAFLNPPVKGDREPKPQYNIRLDHYRKGQQNGIAAQHSLLYFRQEKILNDVQDQATLISQWQTFMGDTFCIKADLLAQFFPVFGNSKRYPNGLITYGARLQTLPQKEKARLMPLLGKFAGAVLDGTFPQIRYSFTDNKHLETLFSGELKLLKKWQTSLPIKIDRTTQKTAAGETPLEQVQKMMRDALENHHLGTDQDSKYPEIQAILAGTFTPLTETDEQRMTILLNCAAVLNPKTDLQIKSALGVLQKLFPYPSSQFHHDLKGMIAQLEAPQSASLQWIIEDTDAWEDFLLMGTEPDNSCQSIQREPAYNKCLLSSMHDGKSRLMVARDAAGKLAGRAVLRILWDAVEKKHVLFVDKLYTRRGFNREILRSEILEGCKQKAQSMGIPLAASAKDYTDLKANKYPGVLQALGGPAPYEYVDALSGILKDGIYSIPGSYLLWSP